MSGSSNLTISQMLALAESLDVSLSYSVAFPYIDESQSFGDQNLAANLGTLSTFRNLSVVENLTSSSTQIQVPNEIGVIALIITGTAPSSLTINMMTNPLADSTITFISNQAVNVVFATTISGLIFIGAPSSISPTTPVTFQFIENVGWWRR